MNEPNLHDSNVELLVTKDMFNTEMKRLKSDIMQTLSIKVTILEGHLFDLENENKEFLEEVDTKTKTENRLGQTLYAVTLTNDKSNEVE